MPDFRKLFESVPGLYLVLTPNLTIVAVTDAYLRVTMARRQDLMGRAPYDVFPDDPAVKGAHNLRASLNKVLRDRVPDATAVQKSCDLWPGAQGGGYEERYWSPINSPVLNDSGEVAYIIHRVEDVTEFVRFKQQDAEQGRRNEELRLRAEKVEAEISVRAKEVQQLNRFFVISPDLLCIANMTGSFLRVNPAFTETLGHTAEELTGRPFINFVHPDDRPATLAELEKLSQGQPTIQFENRYQCKDGSWKWLSWKTQPSLEEGLLYVTARDVTESKLVSRRIVASGVVADSANRAKSEFLANMSHEIRTPLTAIVGYTDLMLDPAQPASDRLDCINVIRRNGDHLLTIINDILDISKIEAGEMQLEIISFSPFQLLNDIASIMRVRAKDKKLQFEMHVEGLVPQMIHSDPTRLRQILMNLVGNAVKFTECGWVRVVMKLVNVTENGAAHLRFEVTDSGIGISSEALDRLFQPFAQADSSTTRRFGGSGLGLFISRKLALMLGGDISVDTQPGRGSMFALDVDPGSLEGIKMLAQGNEVMTPMEEPVAITTLELSGQILLAEDSMDNQRLLAFYLRRAGANVVVADNGRVACDKALQAMADGSPFDLILMDMQMPELDGYAASAKLRSSGYKGPIVALTAHAMATDRQKCISSGCNDYLSKPLTRAGLVDMARRYLNEGQAASISSAAPPLSTSLVKPEGIDDEVIRQFLPAYVAHFPETVCRLEDLLEHSDNKGLAELLHQLKGSSGLYGFALIMGMATQTETSALQDASFAIISEQVKTLINIIRSVEGYDRKYETAAHQKIGRESP